MNFLFITIFPEQILAAANFSILKRAQDAGLIKIFCINPRDFTTDKHRSVDDTPFGGGVGMVLKPEPFVAAIRQAKKELPTAKVVALCPSGKTLNQNIVKEYAKKAEDIIFLCGHYEGFDERIFAFVDEKISVGDYVVTGGELPAVMLMDAISRYIPGVLGKIDSAAEESFADDLLEYPQYTRPDVFEGMEVPEVLRSGDHAKIAAWRLKKSLLLTYKERKDLLNAEHLGLMEGTLQKKMCKTKRKFWDEVQKEVQKIKNTNKE